MGRDLLAQLTDRWAGRVAVKRDELDLDGHFDPELPDFPARLVPLFALPGMSALESERTSRVLSAAWVAYNAKTGAVEEEVILPACRLLLENRLPFRGDDIARTAVHQTVIDEHYHILMCMNAAGVTHRRRGLGELRFPAQTWSVVRSLQSRRAGLHTHEADLVTLGYALAAESTINAFLLTVSRDFDIQPMNRLTVELHRQDESGHAAVFRDLAVHLFHRLGPADRELFKDALREGIRAFRSPDHASWTMVAAAAELSVEEGELAEAAVASPPLPRDTGPLRRLLSDLGIAEEFTL